MCVFLKGRGLYQIKIITNQNKIRHNDIDTNGRNKLGN